MSLKTVFIITVPLCAALIFILAILSRSENPEFERRMREREELERLIQREVPERPVDPKEALKSFKKSHEEHLAGNPAGAGGVQKARDALLKLDEKSLPSVKGAIYDNTEPALLRMELVGILGDMSGSEAESLLLTVLLDRNLEERLRGVALSKLTGRKSDAVFQALRTLYQENTFPGKHLILKAIGETNHAGSASILIEALKREKDVSIKIQALDSLGVQASSPALEAARTVLFQESDENIRIAAIAALGKAQDATAGKLLEEISQSPEMSPALRKAAINWLQRRAHK